MKTPKFGILGDSDIVNSVREMAGEAAIMKKEIFRTSFMHKSLDRNVCTNYLTIVNDYLKFWDDYSKDLQEKIKGARGAEGVYSLDYYFVKDHIYAKYDYASIVLFIDGVIQGVSSGKFNRASDIADFFDHSISKAFPNMGENYAAVLDAAIVDNGISNTNQHKSSLTDAKLFDSIRSYNIFDRRNRAELYKAISEVVKFTTSDTGVGKYINTGDIKLYVSMINNIVDYITYSLTVFATRIYVISAYAYPFINYTSNEASSAGEIPVTEAAVNEDPTNGDTEVIILRNADDMICRDPSKTKEFITIFSDFIGKIGADHLFGSNKPSWDGRNWDKRFLEQNVFSQKLLTNPLHEFLTSKRFDYTMYDSSSSNIMELNQIVKTLIYNNTQGIQGVSSPKQEILHVIRGIGTDRKTLDDYKNLAKELYLFTIHLCWNTSSMIDNIVRWKEHETEHPRHNTGVLNSASETLKIVSEFYRDLVEAIMQKCREIEMNINTVRQSEVNKIVDGINIKIPNQKSDHDENSVMMIGVPDTTRIPTELMDLYDMPTFESLMLYDEYAKNLPGMENDIYYSEAFNISSIIDAIIAHITSAWKRFDAFWKNKSVQSAIKWVTDHERELMAMDFSSASMSVLPYKLEISLPKGFDNLTKGLTNDFSVKNIETKEAAEKFIKGLYPDETVYGWFNTDKSSDGKSGAAKYRNYILFKDENEVTEAAPAPITLDGAKIQRAVPEWISTLKTTKATYDSFKKINDDIDRGIKNIKNKMVGLGNSSTTGQQPEGGAPVIKEGDESSNAAGSTGTAENKSSTPAPNNDSKKQDDKMNETGGIAGTTLADIDKTVQRIFVPLSPIFIEYIKTSYKYLQEAYSMGRKK